MSMGVAVVMLVVAMLIMVMVIIMMMRVVMVMTVIMVMAGMAMLVIVRGVCGGIGAALGIERSLDLDHASAKPLHHRLDDMVTADAQALTDDLRRQMAVAEMPGDTYQMQGISAPNFSKRLGRRHYFNQPSVFQHQRVATAQRDGVLEIEQEFEAARARHRHPPPVAVVEIKHDRIGGRFHPPILSPNLRRAHHGSIMP
jgi:hypothetical protein